MTNPAYKRILAAILIIAFLLRVPGISWGLRTFETYGSEHSFHPDEFKIILGAKGYPRDIVTRTDFRYPTGLHYILGMLTLPLRLSQLAMPAPFDIDIYYILGRFLMVLSGVMGVYLCYQLGRKILTPTAGLLAAGILAVSFYHVRGSALVLADVATTVLMLVAVLITLDIGERSLVIDFVRLGAVMGLLVGIKYTGAFIAIPVGIISLGKHLQLKWPEQKRVLSTLGISVLTAFVVFLITTPGFFLAFNSFKESLSYELNRTGQLKSSLFSYQTWAYLFGTLRGFSNFLFASLSILGVLYALRKSAFWKMLPYTILIILYLMYFNTSLSQRYLLTIVPFLCLLIAGLLIDLFGSRLVLVRGISVLSMVVLIAYGLFQSIELAYLIQTDSRYQAAEYIEKEIPAGSSIAMGWRGREPSCYFSVRSDHSLVTIEDEPDYIFLCGGDTLPAGQYELITEYKMKSAMTAEFLSPEFRIYYRRD